MAMPNNDNESSSITRTTTKKSYSYYHQRRMILFVIIISLLIMQFVFYGRNIKIIAMDDDETNNRNKNSILIDSPTIIIHHHSEEEGGNNINNNNNTSSSQNHSRSNKKSQPDTIATAMTSPTRGQDVDHPILPPNMTLRSNQVTTTTTTTTNTTITPVTIRTTQPPLSTGTTAPNTSALLAATTTMTTSVASSPPPPVSSSSLSSSSSIFNFKFHNHSELFPLPNWLETFLQTSQPIATHNQSLSNPKQKFIVMTCHKWEGTKDEECGGFSDRMKLLPYYLWLAKKSQRMLLIMYTKPHPLEEFLIPPSSSNNNNNNDFRGSFDWRSNGYFQSEFDRYANRTQKEYKWMRRAEWDLKIDKYPWNETRIIFANNNLAIPFIMRRMYNLTGLKVEDVQGGIWRYMFEPSQPVAKIITQTALEHHLIPGQYAGAHFRAKFPTYTNNDWGTGTIKLNSRRVDKMGGGLAMEFDNTRYYVQEFSHNALNCALHIMPETQLIYFASDANEPLEYIVRDSVWAKQQPNNNITATTTTSSSSTGAIVPQQQQQQRPINKPTVVVRLDYDQEPVHFDKDKDRSPDPSYLYPTFVDLWFLAHAKCISADVGGYSEYAAQLTGNFHTCHIRHRGYGDVGMIPCPVIVKNSTDL